MKKLLNLFFLCFFLILPSNLFADSALSDDCLVELKVMRGNGRRKAKIRPSFAKEIKRKDVRRQLETLPYANYRMLSLKKKRTRIGTETEFRVNDVEGKEHSIRVQPLSVNPNRSVNVKLNWHGPSGRNYVSTRMRVARDKCMTIGTDGKKNNSTIISIRSDCE